MGLSADKLREMADILELQNEDGFRLAAYRRAARTLMDLGYPVDEMVRSRGLEGRIGCDEHAHKSNCTTGKEDGRGVGRGLARKRGQHSEQGGHFVWPQRGK